MLTQYTASSSRNAQLGQLDLISIFMGIVPLPLKAPRVKVQVFCDHWRVININRKLCTWIEFIHFFFCLCWKASIQMTFFKNFVSYVECFMLFALSRKFYFMFFVHLCLQTPWFWIHVKNISCDVRCCDSYERPTLIKSNFGEKSPWLKIEPGDILHITQQPKWVLLDRR